MSDLGMERDAITYSALISALSKGRQWGLAIDVFNHMVADGVECDAVTCCSLITALDKGGQWQLAEQVGTILAVRGFTSGICACSIWVCGPKLPHLDHHSMCILGDYFGWGRHLCGEAVSNRQCH
jgi:pentatricopeptide repeat protein